MGAQAYEEHRWRQLAQISGRFDFLELFAGIGGFRFALEALGGRCVFASEVDQECQETRSWGLWSVEERIRIHFISYIIYMSIPFRSYLDLI